MKVGSKNKLVCPSDIAYGDKGAPPLIKPGATLVFEVELLEIVEAKEAPGEILHIVERENIPLDIRSHPFNGRFAE